MLALCGVHLDMMFVLVDEESACVSFAKRQTFHYHFAPDVEMRIGVGCSEAATPPNHTLPPNSLHFGYDRRFPSRYKRRVTRIPESNREQSVPRQLPT